MPELTEVKQQARRVWALGHYPTVGQLIEEMGRITVARIGPREGEQVLDVACGAGNATIPAAQRGARVTGLDLVPELLEAGRAAARDAGVEIEWVEGDAEVLPFDDQSFDVVLSTVGVMFAPDHRQVAAEVVRVLRSGGRFGIASWTPEGNLGKFFMTTAKHMPPPPEGFQPPIMWGSEEHVRELFKGTGVELEFERHSVEFAFESREQAVETFETKYGPILAAKAALEPEGKWEALRSDMVALFDDFNTSEAGDVRYPGEYLLALGHKD